MAWQQNGTDLPNEESAANTIDTGEIWRRHQRAVDQKEIDALRAQVANLFALLQRVSLKCDAGSCTLESPCVGCAVGIELMRCGSDGIRKTI